MIVCADARRIPLGDEAVQCVVTSPPYWGLRKYAGNQGAEPYGLEPAIEMYVAHTVEILREVRRVLRSDGVCFLNLGDSYFSGPSVRRDAQKNGKLCTEPQGSSETGYACHDPGDECEADSARRIVGTDQPSPESSLLHAQKARGKQHLDSSLDTVGDVVRVSLVSTKSASSQSSLENPSGQSCSDSQQYRHSACNPPVSGTLYLKPKDLCLIPARVALAAQADGWWVRSMIIWAKPNPMPESVTDRPTDAYEHILMLTKSKHYFWDADAVREPSGGWNGSRFDDGKNLDVHPNVGKNRRSGNLERKIGIGSEDDHLGHSIPWEGFSRNLRNVWTFPTQPYKGAHFATFPEEIPRRCILAATSVRGACLQCGAPWERVVREEKQPRSDSFGKKEVGEFDHGQAGSPYMETVDSQTIGWRPGCLCRGQRGRTAPCLVLDPFGGSGTTGRVAVELNRRAVLLDLAYGHAYGPLAKARTTNVQRRLVSA